jgi:GSH-dependent disulfide-bond oxidoreductase
MIDLYTWATPNGRKASIMLEEVGLPYTVHPINIGKGEQFQPEFLAVSPNNKIPGIVDSDGPGGKPLSLFESGAILFYLAEKTGRFFPSEPVPRYHAMQWLMFQMGGVGPMFGQNHHFRQESVNDPYGLQRYAEETARLYRVMDTHLAGSEYFAEGYGIADMAIYPWVARHPRHKTELADFPHVKRWYDLVGARPAVQKGMAVPFAN